MMNILENSFRTFGERYKEHLKELSAIHGHHTTTDYPINMNNFSITDKKGHGFARIIKKSIYKGK